MLKFAPSVVLFEQTIFTNSRISGRIEPSKWFTSRCQKITVVISGWTFIGAAWNFMHLLIYASGRRIKAIRCSSKSQLRFPGTNVEWSREMSNAGAWMRISWEPATFDLTLIRLLARVDRESIASLNLHSNFETGCPHCEYSWIWTQFYEYIWTVDAIWLERLMFFILHLF